MKNSILLASVCVVCFTSISLAQFSGGINDVASKAINVNSYSYNVQDTTKKPLRDTVPVKTDSLPVKRDSTAFNF